MNELEHLAACVGEEAGEVAEAALALMAARRVGERAIDTAAQALAAELNDLVGATRLLAARLPVLLSCPPTSAQAHAPGPTPELDLALAALRAQKAVSKLLRFGPEDVHPKRKIRAADVLGEELWGVIAAAEAVREVSPELGVLWAEPAIVAKQERVQAYMAYARDTCRSITDRDVVGPAFNGP